MKAVVDTLEAVPEALRGEYESQNGKFVLRVEGPHPGFASLKDLSEANTRLAEFRDNNRNLNGKVTEIEQQLAKFTGIDPVAAKEAADKIKALEAKGIKGSDDVATAVQTAVKAAVGPLEEKLRVMETTERETRAANDRLKLETELTAAGTKAGVNPAALPDYIERGLKTFKIVDGKPVARKGDTPIFSATRPANPLSMDEWAAQQQVEAAHLFLPSKGGGAGGSNGGENGGGGGRHSNKKTISNDPAEFGKNLEGIAKGEIIVMSPE